MSDNVVSIKGTNYATVADCVNMPDDLELLAQRIRSGEVSATRGILIYQSADTCVHHLALGGAITKLEMMGLLGWILTEVK